MPPPAPLDNVSVVLVEPRYGGNLGAVARVMGNFGLERLILVNPAPGILADARLEPMARKAADLARSAHVVGDLREALADVELALGFTTRLGRRRRDGYDLRQAVAALREEAPRARIAAVFGREDAGLSNAELEACQWLVRIPTRREFSSLNLAQAVGLFAYELAAGNPGSQAPGPRSRTPASGAELEGMYGHFERVLGEIGFFEEESPARMMNELRRILSRRLPDPRDVRILRGILSRVEWALERSAGGHGRPPRGPGRDA